MTQPQHQQYRSHTTPPANRIQYRQPDDGEDGVFEVRMPIATTGEVRNQGDDPLTRDELDGMRQQIEERTVGVFLDHGGTNLGGMERYSAVEKVGEWRDPELATRDDEDGPAELVATAELMDPESLPAGVGDLRAALGSIKEQVKRDFSVSASIGWREDDSYPGGNDLMEASIVGIGADPRTTSDAEGEGVGVVARAAIEAGADPNQLLNEVRSAIDVDGERPLGPPEDPERFDSFEECKQALMEDEDLSEEEAERICGSWENQSVDNESVTEQDDTPSEDGGTTDDEQNEETDEERAPEDIGPADFAEFVASHYDGLDAADVTDALDEAGGDYAGSVDVPELASFVADVTDTDTGEAQDALDSLMDGGENEADEDDEDEEENEADEDDEDDDGEEGGSETQSSDDSDIEERLADLEEILEDVRSGETGVETPGSEEPEEEQDTDGETTSTATTEKWGRRTN